MLYKSYDNLSEDIKKHLNEIQEKNFDLVVGIPRSGMIPAYMIGLYINIQVTSFDNFLSNAQLKTGRTRNAKKIFQYPHDAKNILFVDDSIESGGSLKEKISEIPDDLKEKITTLAIYSSTKNRSDIDIFFEHVPLPRAFEWNIFHRDLLGKACVDIDGVLCVDPTNDENDDGEKYIHFIENAKPHILPSYKIHSLVTTRLEKYRPQTEKWLKNHNIEYENLIMLDLPSKEERQRQGAYGKHKAQYYRSMPELDVFIESDVNQAIEIMKISSKPVYCVDDNIMLLPNQINMALKNPKTSARRLKEKIKRRIPQQWKPVLLPIYRMFIKKN